MPVDARLAISFSEPVDTRTVTAATFTVRAGELAVEGAVETIDGGALFTPLAPLAGLTSYVAEVSPQITDLAGNCTWTTPGSRSSASGSSGCSRRRSGLHSRPW